MKCTTRERQIYKYEGYQKGRLADPVWGEFLGGLKVSRRGAAAGRGDMSIHYYRFPQNHLSSVSVHLQYLYTMYNCTHCTRGDMSIHYRFPQNHLSSCSVHLQHFYTMFIVQGETCHKVRHHFQSDYCTHSCFGLKTRLSEFYLNSD